MALPNRIDFQVLAIERLEDAKALVASGRSSGAYYIAGYAIECALKACIAKRINAGDFPPSPETVKNAYYKHDLKTLLKTAELEVEMKRYSAANAGFAANWSTVTSWDETRRYAFSATLQQAAEFVDAIDDPNTGVLQWLQMHW